MLLYLHPVMTSPEISLKSPVQKSLVCNGLWDGEHHKRRVLKPVRWPQRTKIKSVLFHTSLSSGRVPRSPCVRVGSVRFSDSCECVNVQPCDEPPGLAPPPIEAVINDGWFTRFFTDKSHI